MALIPLTRSEFKKMMTKGNNPEMNQNHIRFSVIGFDYDHERISESLSLIPRSIELKGDKIIRNEKIIRIVEENSWDFEIKNYSNDYLSDHIEEFFNQYIYPNYKELKDLVKNCKCLLTIVQYYYTSHNPGYNFSNKLLKTLSDLNGELQLDIYCLREETE